MHKCKKCVWATWPSKWLVTDIEKQQIQDLRIKGAKTMKHASSKPTQTDNEKYTFRTWLIRLGMIGDEYKATRKHFLPNLEGNGAFRRGAEETK